jgi:hypothetical protein
VFAVIAAPLSADDDNNVRSVVVDLKMQIAELQALIPTKKAALEKARAARVAADAEWQKIKTVNHVLLQVTKASMVIALSRTHATDKTRKSAEALFRELVVATEIASNTASLKSTRARDVAVQLCVELNRTKLDLARASRKLQNILK